MKSLLLFTALSVTLCSHTFCQTEATRQKNFNLSKSVALEGYDPVSYFSGKPVEGNESLSYRYLGVTYWFASAANRSKFQQNPASYEPAYGGWCAYAMGEDGEKVKVDPETYKIVDGPALPFLQLLGEQHAYFLEQERAPPSGAGRPKLEEVR